MDTVHFDQIHFKFSFLTFPNACHSNTYPFHVHIPHYLITPGPVRVVCRDVSWFIVLNSSRSQNSSEFMSEVVMSCPEDSFSSFPSPHILWFINSFSASSMMPFCGEKWMVLYCYCSCLRTLQTVSIEFDGLYVHQWLNITMTPPTNPPHCLILHYIQYWN